MYVFLCFHCVMSIVEEENILKSIREIQDFKCIPSCSDMLCYIGGILFPVSFSKREEKLRH